MVNRGLTIAWTWVRFLVFGELMMWVWAPHIKPSSKQKRASLWGGALILTHPWCSMRSRNWQKNYYLAGQLNHNGEDITCENRLTRQNSVLLPSHINDLHRGWFILGCLFSLAFGTFSNKLIGSLVDIRWLFLPCNSKKIQLANNSMVNVKN